MVLAEDGYLPSLLSRCAPITGAPTVSIVVCGIAWAVSLLLGFDRLVELDVLIYGFALLLSFLALIRLRVKEPDLLRPFQVPGGIFGVSMLGLGPMLLVALGFYRGEFHSAAGDDYLVSALLGGLVVLGPLIYGWTVRRSRAQAAASLVE